MSGKNDSEQHDDVCVCYIEPKYRCVSEFVLCFTFSTPIEHFYFILFYFILFYFIFFGGEVILV